MDGTRPLSSRDIKIDRRVPQIDGLRALGMYMVYLFHVWEFGWCPVWNVRILGYKADLFGFLGKMSSGVDLFMVISGFCLFWPLCSSAETLRTWDWRGYARRRVNRIVPPYYAAIGYAIFLPMLLVAIFKALKIQANWQPVPSAWQLFTHFLFIHSLFPSTWDGITGSFWSLGLEAQFYVVFPLVVFAFRRSGIKVIWLLIAASVLFRTAVGATGASGEWQNVFSMSFLGRWMEFGFGMLTALAVAKYWRQARVTGAALGTAQAGGALALYVLTVGFIRTNLLYSVPLYELGLSMAFSLLIFALCTSRTPVAKLFRNPVVDWLGVISYSLYLLHQPTAWYLSEFFRKVLHLTGVEDVWVLATVGFVVVVAISYLFFLVFEKPSMAKNKTLKNAGAAPSVPALADPVEKEPALG